MGRESVGDDDDDDERAAGGNETRAGLTSAGSRSFEKKGRTRKETHDHGSSWNAKARGRARVQARLDRGRRNRQDDLREEAPIGRVREGLRTNHRRGGAPFWTFTRIMALSDSTAGT